MEMTLMKIGDLAIQVKTGSTPLTSDILNFEDATYNWYTPGDFAKSKIILRKAQRKISQYAVDNSATIFKPKTVLITCIGEIGNSCIIEEEASSNQQITGVLVNEEIINPYLFNYLILHNKRKLKDKSKQAVVSILNNKNLKEIELSFPKDLETQNKIVAILDKAKSILEKRERTIVMYDELLRATFLDMFGDPFINPQKWVIDKLGNYLEFIGDIGSNGSNATITKNLKMLDEKDYAIMIRTVNLSKNNFTDNLKYCSKETYEFFKKSKIYGGEIIMNKIGSAGDFWLMPILNTPVTLGLNQLVIRPKNLENLFLFHFLSSDYGRSIVKSKTRGAATQSITKSAIKELEIIIPPLALQKTFSEIVIKIEKIKIKLIQAKTKTSNLLNAISQLAFKGELDFNTAVDLEVLLENDYDFFKKNSNPKAIQLLIERLDKDELNDKKFYEQDTYDKAKGFVFELLKEGKVKQVFDKKTKQIKLSVK